MKKILLSVLLLLSTNALAVWSPSIKVNEILAVGPEDGSGFIVIVSDVIGVGAELGSCSGTYHYINVGTEKGKMIFSLLLTAKTTDKALRFDLTQAGSAARCAIVGVRF
ncbi:MAG: hypothetical protein HRT35_12460 [Algicola sp.]|nr:hypothetical protein [Algicola sp.]